MIFLFGVTRIPLLLLIDKRAFHPSSYFLIPLCFVSDPFIPLSFIQKQIIPSNLHWKDSILLPIPEYSKTKAYHLILSQLQAIGTHLKIEQKSPQNRKGVIE